MNSVKFFSALRWMIGFGADTVPMNSKLLGHGRGHAGADLVRLGRSRGGLLERLDVLHHVLGPLRRLDTFGAVRLQPLAPQHRVARAEIVLVGRHPQLVVAQHDGDRLALAPGDHVQLVGRLGRAVLVRGHFLDLGLDAHIGPVLRHELHHGRRAALGRELQVDAPAARRSAARGSRRRPHPSGPARPACPWPPSASNSVAWLSHLSSTNSGFGEKPIYCCGVPRPK